MAIRITEGPVTAAGLAEYARVPIAYRVERVLELRVEDAGLGGFALVERAVERPYVKDYDALAGEGPARWHRRFDVANWGALTAWVEGDTEGDAAGGAVIAFDTIGVRMLEGRSDLAVLWDLRVAPALRGRGIGTALFRAAERWAAARGCRQLKIETQNVNVPACRFYVRRGCILGAIDRFAYPALPGEVQLVWYRAVSSEQ